MKAILICSIRSAAWSGVRLIFTPRASRTSALPERLEMDRLPCLATGMPAAAAIRAVAVEIL